MRCLTAILLAGIISGSLELTFASRKHKTRYGLS